MKLMHNVDEESLITSSSFIDKEVITRDLLETTEILRKIDDKFYKIFDLNPCPMAISDLKTNVLIDVNDAFVEIVGFKSKNEVIGKPTTEVGLKLIKQADKDRIINMLVNGNEVKNIFVNFRNCKGKKLTGLFSASFIELNDKDYLLTLCQVIKKKCIFNIFF